MGKIYTNASTVLKDTVDALNSDMSDDRFNVHMEIIQDTIKQAFIYGTPYHNADLHLWHSMEFNPRIDNVANEKRVVPILFGFSENHTVGYAQVYFESIDVCCDAKIRIYCAFPPHHDNGESMHLKIRLGCRDGRLKPVTVISNGIIQYIALAHPAFESSVIDIEEAAEIYALIKRGYE